MRRSDAEGRSLAGRAQEAEERQDWSDAADLLLQALHNNPGDAALHLRIAKAYFKDGKPAPARRHLIAAEAAELKQEATYVEMARLAMQLDDLERAQRLLENVVFQNDANTEALLLQAKLHERTGNHRRAMAVYHHVLSVEPDNNRAKVRLASNQIEVGHPDRAAVLLRSVCQCPEISPTERTEAYRQLGRAYAQTGRWQDALTALEEVIRNRQHATEDDQRQLAEVRRRVQRQPTGATGRIPLARRPVEPLPFLDRYGRNRRAEFQQSADASDRVRPSGYERRRVRGPRELSAAFEQ